LQRFFAELSEGASGFTRRVSRGGPSAASAAAIDAELDRLGF
jgi:hypothetical protein